MVAYRFHKLQLFIWDQYEIGTYGLFAFLACPPCKLKLYTWAQVDYLIDHICNSEGPEYRTKLKCETDEGDVGKLKKTASKEKRKGC